MSKYAVIGREYTGFKGILGIVSAENDEEAIEKAEEFIGQNCFGGGATETKLYHYKSRRHIIF